MLTPLEATNVRARRGTNSMDQPIAQLPFYTADIAKNYFSLWAWKSCKFNIWNAHMIQSDLKIVFPIQQQSPFVLLIFACVVKASAHSFKLLCTRNLCISFKWSFSLCTYIPRMNVSLISFVWHQSTCQERIESEKMRNEKCFFTVGLEPRALRFEVWCFTNWANWAVMLVESANQFSLKELCRTQYCLKCFSMSYRPSDCLENP